MTVFFERPLVTVLLIGDCFCIRGDACRGSIRQAGFQGSLAKSAKKGEKEESKKGAKSKKILGTWNFEAEGRRRGRGDQRGGHAGRHGDAKAASSRLLCPAGGGRQVVFPPCTPLSAPPDQGATWRVHGACKADRASGGGKGEAWRGKV